MRLYFSEGCSQRPTENKPIFFLESENWLIAMIYLNKQIPLTLYNKCCHALSRQMGPKVIVRYFEIRSRLKIAATARDPSGYLRSGSVLQHKVLVDPCIGFVNGDNHDFVVTFIG